MWRYTLVREAVRSQSGQMPDFVDVPDLPFVSVLIPVFNDQERLCLCLKALSNQTYPRDRYEVIVIDNGSEHDLSDMASEFPDVTFLRELRPGSYTARNRGLAIAKGSIIALTDADCVPEMSWIQAGVERLSRTANCGLVAGNVLLFFKNPKRPNAAELYDAVTSFQQKKFIEKYHFGATANVFTYKHVFDNVGLFNDQLRSGGDREWGQRVHAAGYQLVYADEVRIQHPARSSFIELKNRNIRLTAGSEHTRTRKKFVRLKMAKTLLKDILPYRKLYMVWTSKRLQGVKQRLIVTGVLLQLQMGAAITRLRVWFGLIGEIR